MRSPCPSSRPALRTTRHCSPGRDGQQAPRSHRTIFQGPRITAELAEADWLVQAALSIGAERGLPPPAVAVVDVAGEVIVLRRDDGGMPMTSRIAVAKARTALLALRRWQESRSTGGQE
ncbi:heme-binding protein [Streptomyces gibsoniae]|uniref:heme-binding protein n=1 Tax=Streptomyces gibsoniae TaxID=3075529 RepID=UPI00374E1253